jgi:beta-glucosidase
MAPTRAVLVGLALLACTPAPSTVDAGADGGGDAAVPDGGRTYVPDPFTPTPETIAYCAGHDDAAIEARITALLADLGLREKLAMMHGASIGVVDGTWVVEGNARTGIPGLHMLDGPRGVSSFTRLRATAFPVAAMRGATWDPALEERVGHAMGVEIRSAGADVILAPTMNILRHPRWGRAQETYSEDTMHMGALALAFVRGVQSEGVLASAKHFAANSIEDTRHTVDVEMDERTLREIYLPHFRRVVVEGHVASVMSAYNQVDGLYCDQQAHLLTDILRDEWGFAGFVESDWLRGTHGSVDSVRAGLDIEMPALSHFRPLESEVLSGAIDEHELDASVRRILRAQLCFGLDALPTRTPGTIVDDPTQRETPAHLALAEEVARRGIVLLRNEGSALPIDGVTSIVVLGRNADEENIGDRGSSGVDSTDVVTAIEGLTTRAGSVTVTHVPGTTLDAAAEATVRAADVAIIVTGLDKDDEGEGEIAAGDRESLEIPADDLALIHAVAAVHDRVVVVLEGGGPLLTRSWESEVEAILFAFYPGARGGEAIADVVFGDHAPSGRLPFSVPVAESDLPPFDNVSDTVTYGYFHGYRHLAHEGTAAAYSFGFGLSYTTFAYSNLIVSTDTVAPDGSLTVTVTVTNEGTRTAIETVQLYVAAMGSRVERAPEDLRGFAQVELAAGASADVTIPLAAADLAFWDEADSSWEVEAIDYELHVGAHAGDPRLTSILHIAP